MRARLGWAWVAVGLSSVGLGCSQGVPSRFHGARGGVGGASTDVAVSRGFPDPHGEVAWSARLNDRLGVGPREELPIGYWPTRSRPTLDLARRATISTSTTSITYWGTERDQRRR